MDRRPFPSREQILAELKKPQPLEPGRRFKYSNHGFALAGMILEQAAGESYDAFMARDVLGASGLRATTTDMPARRDFPFAKGHSLPLSDGKRLVVPADQPTHGVAPAGGFVATPSDVARFFATLAPDAPRSVLSRESRIDMSRRYHRDNEGPVPLHYGLGTIIGPQSDDWDWFGHSGSFQGTLSRTAVVPAHHLAVSVMTNGLDGLATLFVDGIIGILKAHFRRGGADRITGRWRGRFHSLWGPVDLVPVAGRVLVAAPGAFAPLAGAPEIQPIGRDKGMIVKGSGFGSVGEMARIERDGRQRPVALWIGGARLLPRAKMEAEMRKRFGGRRRGGQSQRR
jgi:CubicO group peptidase (beta-lactamase class C family)